MPLDNLADNGRPDGSDHTPGHDEPGGHARAPAEEGGDQPDEFGGEAPAAARDDTTGPDGDADAGRDGPVLEIQGDLLGERPDRAEPEEEVVSERERGLEAALNEARAETEQRLDDLRRLKAEFENFRKRTQRDQSATRASASSALVTRLLPVLDNFELAISSAEQSQDFEKMLKGVEMVFGELREVLRSEGVAEIAAEGTPFDPKRHEAVVAVEAEDVEPGTVVGVVRTGYELQGKVLRPAMVKVAQ